MITNGGNSIKKVVVVNWDGNTMSPCGVCREFMAQLMHDDYRNIEVMLDYESKRIVSLGALTPDWWI